MNDTNAQHLPQDVKALLASVDNEQRAADSLQLIRLMSQATGQQPFLWGSTIIGFGLSHYKYESGREGDTVTIGFAPRKQALVLYGVIYHDQNSNLLEKLGTHKAGKGCLYIKRLADVDIDVLRQMITTAFKNKSTT